MRKKILVVDDDPEAVELLSFNLKKAGFAIGTAFDGIEALKKARTISPDLILLDLMLPELDGFAVCELLRRNAATAAIPVIMLTAMSSELGRLAGMDCGAQDYVTKPFSLKQLVSKVETVLKKSRHSGRRINSSARAEIKSFREGNPLPSAKSIRGP
jgi:DNA-binding response OmpR family regulator